MNRGKLLGVGLLVVVFIVIGGLFFFVMTGGNALTRVAWNYLIKDLPDKKYSWVDFTDRGINEGISGFYAFGDMKGFAIWTLSGLKYFKHVPDVSIYQYEDVCEMMRRIRNNPDAVVKLAPKEVSPNILFWQTLIKKENLVSVVRMKDVGPKNRVDKVWSYSGIYKELNKLDQDSCK